jgi:hypothetical protein
MLDFSSRSLTVSRNFDHHDATEAHPLQLFFGISWQSSGGGSGNVSVGFLYSGLCEASCTSASTPALFFSRKSLACAYPDIPPIFVESQNLDQVS